jgi:hypothetical protein
VLPLLRLVGTLFPFFGGRLTTFLLFPHFHSHRINIIEIIIIYLRSFTTNVASGTNQAVATPARVHDHQHQQQQQQQQQEQSLKFMSQEIEQK